MADETKGPAQDSTTAGQESSQADPAQAGGGEAQAAKEQGGAALLSGGEARPEGQTEPAPWLSKDYAEDAAFKDFKGADDLAKAYKEALGKVPQVPETYAANVPEGVKLDEGQFAEASKLGQEIGLTQAQMDRLVQFDLLRSRVYADSQNQAMEASLGKLKSEWGQAWDANLAVANKGLSWAQRTIGDPSIAADLKDPLLCNRPWMLKLMLELGKRVEESPGAGGGSGGGTESSPGQVMYPGMNKNK